jgi:ribosomal protein S18 acetylase RimI-like enzyme
VQDNLVVRNMTEADLALALEWAAAEGWNPGLHDANCFYAADPEGFFLAELDGAPIGCVSAVRYGSGFGFLGLYIVKGEHRGQGFGLELWRAALDHLGDRVIGLDGVVAQQENYRRSGFRLGFRNVRQRGEGGGAAPPGLTDLAVVPIEEMLRYDETAFPGPRTEFLKPWVGQAQAVALGVVDGQRLKGYGVLIPIP